MIAKPDREYTRIWINSSIHNKILVSVWYETVAIKFSLNILTEFAEFSDNFFVKRLFEVVTSCEKDQDITTEQAEYWKNIQ